MGPSASTSQTLARIAVPRSRPRTLERSQQRPQTVSGGEGTSIGASRDTSGPSSFGSQILLGHLACLPDLMIRGWVPPGELSRQYLRIDTSLEPVFYPETATHINFTFLEPYLFLSMQFHH